MPEQGGHLVSAQGTSAAKSPPVTSGNGDCMQLTAAHAEHQRNPQQTRWQKKQQQKHSCKKQQKEHWRKKQQTAEATAAADGTKAEAVIGKRFTYVTVRLTSKRI